MGKGKLFDELIAQDFSDLDAFNGLVDFIQEYSIGGRHVSYATITGTDPMSMSRPSDSEIESAVCWMIQFLPLLDVKRYLRDLQKGAAGLDEGPF